MNNFDIIHHRGQVTKATTLQGVVVERQERLFIVEWGAFVPCAPYDDHFVYENPDTSVGSPSYMCTCGSVAVVINPERNERLFVCLFHATYGSHTTSHVNLKDFGKSAGGGTLETKPGSKRWV